MGTCKEDHRFHAMFAELPIDQGGAGRHKCAGCAYERGLEAGRLGAETPEFDLDGLPESQAGSVRHKSPLAAWAQGYYDGMKARREAECTRDLSLSE